MPALPSAVEVTMPENENDTAIEIDDEPDDYMPKRFWMDIAQEALRAHPHANYVQRDAVTFAVSTADRMLAEWKKRFEVKP